MKGLNVSKWLSLISGILFALAGILFLLNPASSTLVIVRVLGVLLITGGILQIVRYFKSVILRSAGTLISGILNIAMGFLMLRYVTTSALVFSYLIGFWVLVNGITEIAVSIDMKRIGVPAWWVELIAGILGIILGFLLIGDFVNTSVYVALMAGISMIVLGISFISMFFSISRFQKYYKE